MINLICRFNDQGDKSVAILSMGFERSPGKDLRAA